MKKLMQYTNKRFKNLESLLDSYQHFPQVEKLHKVRVEIKKIKALLQLINYCVRKFKGHKTFIPLRTIFRKAGKIRQSEVFYKLLLLYQIKGVPDGAVPGAKSSPRLSASFIKQIPAHIKTVRRQRSVMKKYAENVSKECVKKYLKKKKKELQSELYPKLRLERLHKVRKIFKVIIYLSSIEKYSKKKLSNFFRTAETLIGQWHDRQTLTFALMRSKTTSETKRLTTESKVNIVNLKKAIVDYYKKR